jgi:hypothetical protein
MSAMTMQVAVRSEIDFTPRMGKARSTVGSLSVGERKKWLNLRLC